ncbi:MAG: hypothetical protein LBL57_02320 [Tannerella sp.]|jgi:hypothetical protein|nr:hypothetical protein [Tannerella sp.]
MKNILVFFGLFLVMAFTSCKESPEEPEKPEETPPEYELTGEMLQKYNEYNFVVGTQTIGAGSQYKFTEKPVLIETAERILAMGSNILKIHLHPDTETPESFRQASPLVLASQESTFKALLDMNFTYYLLWVMDTPGVEWRNGMSAKELEMEYQSVRELVEYFRDHFRGTGKKFYIGHWEGDWLLLSSAGDAQERVDPVRIQGMIDWYNIRQKAVDDAVNVAVSDVEVFQYLEVNRVMPAMENGFDRIVNKVLPYADVDYVSYSSWETTIERLSEGGYNYPELKNSLFTALDYIEENMKAKDRIKGKRVFVSEYGFPRSSGYYADKQAYCSLNVMKAGIEWGCPFILYWEIYDNEGHGYWMIDKNNVEQPVYKVHQAFYEDMKAYVRSSIGSEQHVPDVAEFRTRAVRVISELQNNLK